jgi:hypothetical protein
MARTFADAARPSSSTATTSPRCWSASTPVRYEAEPRPELQEITGASQRTRSSASQAVHGAPCHLLGRAGLDRPSGPPRAADGICAAPEPRPAVAHGASTSLCTGCRRAGSAPRSSSTSTASSGRRWTWPRSSTLRSSRSGTASTTGAVRLVAAAIWPRWSPLTGASSTSASASARRRGRTQRRQPLRARHPLGQRFSTTIRDDDRHGGQRQRTRHDLPQRRADRPVGDDLSDRARGSRPPRSSYARPFGGVPSRHLAIPSGVQRRLRWTRAMQRARTLTAKRVFGEPCRA